MKHDDYRRRLYDAAEAFYFAGILTSLQFNAAAVAGNHSEVGSVAEELISGQKKLNQLGAPPIVNFGFSIELYIKLLRHLSDEECMRGHDLYELFIEFERFSPNISCIVIKNHFYARGDRKEFLCYLKAEANVFEQWRYAHEKEFLVSSADTLFKVANSFRSTITDLYPDMVSAFVLP